MAGGGGVLQQVLRNKSAFSDIEFTLLTALLRVQHTYIAPSNTPFLTPDSAAVQESGGMVK